MGRSTRRMDESKSEAPPSPEIIRWTDPFTPGFFETNAGTTRPADRCLGTDNLPLGTQERNPSSPFPPETGKRTLETGPSYER